MPTPEDLRFWHLTSFAAGATGLLYPRWRPLLDGPLFGAFAPYGMDGGRTPRSEMTSKLAQWSNAPEQSVLWASRPVQGEVGILVVPETQLFAHTLMTERNTGASDAYARSMTGGYRGFFDHNIQADWVHVDDMDRYRLLYLPFPVMLDPATVARLRAWVAAGGTLVSEGCPAYFGPGGHVGTTQPNLGLDELFGARESYVAFTPDLLDDLVFDLDGAPVPGGIFRQAYAPTTGKPVGWYPDGRVAVVDHVWGEGRTRLVGTMCGAGYAAYRVNRFSNFFAGVLAYGDVQQHVRSSDSRVKARLHDGTGGTYLWVANPSRQPVPVRLDLSDRWGPYVTSRSIWGPEGEVRGRSVTMTVPGRDVAVLRLAS